MTLTPRKISRMIAGMQLIEEAIAGCGHGSIGTILSLSRPLSSVELQQLEHLGFCWYDPDPESLSIAFPNWMRGSEP